VVGARGLLRSAAVGAGVVAAFAVGVVVGVSGREGDRPAGAPGSPVAEAAGVIAADGQKAVPRADLDRAAIQAMLRELDDPYATYRSPGEQDATTAVLDGSYAGLGLWLRADTDGRVVVSTVLPSSAAARGGISPDDELVSINGRGVAHRGVASLVTALRGPAASSVRVVTRSPAGVLRDVRLVRAEVAVQDLGVERLAGGVVRVRVAAFSRGVGAAFRGALAAARRQGEIQGIVLDLRGDPGGLLDEAVTVAGTFLDGGPVVSYARRGDSERVLEAEPGGDARTPLAVLVDSGTASAAEVVAAALQDRRRALVVGTRSFGKGSVQEPVALSDGSSLELTVAHYRTPAGRSLDGTGITPDVAVAAPARGARLGRGDAALDRASSVVGGLLADAGMTAGHGRG